MTKQRGFIRIKIIPIYNTFFDLEPKPKTKKRRKKK